MRKPLIIYGAGGLGREVLSLVRAIEDWEPVGFFDDKVSKGAIVAGLPVLGGRNELRGLNNFQIIVAIGDPHKKNHVVQQIRSETTIFPVLIHPTAILQNKESIYIGAGSVITAGTILTTNIRIGEHTLINLNTTIGHDCVIADYCSIMPGVNVAGEVKIGQSVLVGSGANILNKIEIGAHSKIGMGAVVIHNVPPRCTVVGVPAKPVRP